MKRAHSARAVTLKIENLSGDGSGVARTERGMFFVYGALPGETVTAKILSSNKDFSLARTLTVEEPVKGRTTPHCRYFGLCGGCQLQHASYDLQLKLKADIVKDALIQAGGLKLPRGEIECVASPEQWGYRNKASFPVQAINGRIAAGFYQANSHRLVCLDSCPVNAGPINDIFSVLKDGLSALPIMPYDEASHKGELRHLFIRTGLRTGQSLLSFVINGRLSAKRLKALAALTGQFHGDLTLTLNHNSKPGNMILGDFTDIIKGNGLISERLDNWTLSFDTTSFFQVNTGQAEQLFRHVQKLAGGAKGVLELYSGVGSLTCYLANSGQVTSVEEWRGAVKMASRNMKANKLDVITLCGKAEELVGDLKGSYDCIVLDPPRDGCARPVLKAIADFRTPSVIYVSCNPVTLARDVKILAGYGYKLTSIKAFDMFPQTVHVECVALLEAQSR